MSDLKRRGLNGSLLTMFASQENDQSKIACVVLVKNNSLVAYISETAQLIVYGRLYYMQGIILLRVSICK